MSYDRKSDGQHEIGVVAEDIERIVPEVISLDPETHETEGVDYSRLTAILIEAVKAQQTELTTQQLEIQHLRTELEEISKSAD